MSTFFKKYKLQIICFFLLLSSNIIFAQSTTIINPVLATPEQKAHAIYITDSILINSQYRRDTANNLFNWEGYNTEQPILAGSGNAHLNSTQTYYFSDRLQLDYWWCISSTQDTGTTVEQVYDDMITLNFSNMGAQELLVFDNNDYLIASYRIRIDTTTGGHLSPGTILTGSQTILKGQTATNLICTSARLCSSTSEFQWQRSYDRNTFTDILGATLDSLVVAPSVELLYLLDSTHVSFRRRLVCGSDTAYAGSVDIIIADSLFSGHIYPEIQSLACGQTPAVLYATDSKGGLCQRGYHYQWQVSSDSITFTNLFDKTADTLAFDAFLTNTRYYRRIVYCGGDSAFSNHVTVNVSPCIFSLKPGINPIILPNAVTAPKLPAPYLLKPTRYVRTYTPNIPLIDTGEININAAPEDIGIITVYSDSYGRTLQSVAKQSSPHKRDNIAAADYDEFGRSPIAYMPFVSDSAKGDFQINPFYQDSLFYKRLFPKEKINYSRTMYDGSPFNIPLYSQSPGNSWAGSNRGVASQSRANYTNDSVRLFNIPINSEDDIPQSNGYYFPGTLTVVSVQNEEKMQSVKFVDEMGRTVMTKTLLQSSLVSNPSTWLCTYYVYDEMNHLRMVIPPKASELLKTASVNWNLSDTIINKNLCYAYAYDELGRVTMKRIPGKGKSYTAYDLLNRVVMTQDANLRLTNQWAFVLYDGQSRPMKSGVITTSLAKDSIIAQAARSKNYPSLSGTYIVTSETFYDNYDWVAATSAPVASLLDTTNINSSNFTTTYNAAPDYAQRVQKSLRIRGAVTGVKKLILNSSDYLYSVNFYDDRGRPVQTQQTNYTGATDISTIQYSYSNRVLRTHLKHTKAGVNAQSHTILTKFSYDHVGRIKQVIKNLDGLGDKTITQAVYNESGQLSSKIIGDNLETQAFTYNIRGWVLAINGDYVKTSSSTSNYFGELLSYDSGFINTQYSGNIAGVQWKAGGDGIARAYGFAYDKANRLTGADFYQQNSGSSSWTNDKVDYTVSGLEYDANGNILSMKQRGLMVGSSATIDSLTYQYFTNSNLLQKVSDGIPDISPLGDFKDSTATGDDYTYDVNGNITRDNNRHLHNGTTGPGAVFNLLDKPDSMLINGKSATHYYYDAGGATLRKQVNDYSAATPVIKNYVYISGFVYVNDTLQYALTEEGRIRYAKKTNSITSSPYYAYEYDYFIKDHQGNVRAVLTEGKDTAFYQAKMEVADSVKEDALFANEYTLVRTIAAKPAGFDTDTDNHRVARLSASTGGDNHKTGPSLVLKVMAGDKVQINTYAFYNTTVQQPQSGVNLLSEILSVLPGAVSNNSGGKLGAGNLTSLTGALSPNVTQFLNDNRPFDNARPKAYLNWILFDEQFNFVASNSGVKQVEAGTEKQALVAPQQTMSKNGFLYIYVSNESPQNVYFDDLTVKHISGPLLQEQSYYPFGLQMAGISSKAVLKTLSAYKYNAGSELEDEGELNYYNTFYRKYDAQIGRFTGIDMLAESYAGLTPFQFGNNNPVFYNDPTGAKLERKEEERESKVIHQLPGFFRGLYSQGMQNFENWMLSSMDDAERGTGSGGGGGGGQAWGVTQSSNGTIFSGALAQAIFLGLFSQNNSEVNEINVDILTNIDGNMVGAITSFNSDNSSSPAFSVEATKYKDGKWGSIARMTYTDFSNRFSKLNFIQTLTITEDGISKPIIYDKLVKSSRSNFYYSDDDETDYAPWRLSSHTVNINGLTSVAFADFAGEDPRHNIDWNAQLSLVGMVNGVYQIIFTVSWGYQIINHHFTYPSSLNDRPYQINTVPSNFLINGLPSH